MNLVNIFLIQPNFVYVILLLIIFYHENALILCSKYHTIQIVITIVISSFIKILNKISWNIVTVFSFLNVLVDINVHTSLFSKDPDISTNDFRVSEYYDVVTNVKMIEIIHLS